MKNKSIPLIENLKKKFENFNRFNIIGLIGMVLVIASGTHILINNLYLIKDLTYILLILIFLPLNDNIQYFKAFIFNRGIKPQNLTEEKIGNLSKEELLEILDETVSHLKENKKEIPSFYIYEEYEANAEARDSIFNIVKPLNSIRLSRGLFHYLTPDEIKSIVLHEIGHFTKYIPIIDKFYFILYPFIISVFIIIISFKNFDNDLYHLILSCVVYYAIVIIVNNIKFSISKTLEFLSDYYAAERNGLLVTVNALLRLYYGSEHYGSLIKESVEEIVKFHEIPVENIQKVLELIEKEFYSQKKHSPSFKNKKIQKIIRSEKATQYHKNLSEEEIRELDEFKEEFDQETAFSSSIIDWKLFDENKNNRIDDREYLNFIAVLRKNRQKMLYGIEGIHDEDLPETHPELVERILFLHENLYVN